MKSTEEVKLVGYNADRNGNLEKPVSDVTATVTVTLPIVPAQPVEPSTKVTVPPLAMFIAF